MFSLKALAGVTLMVVPGGTVHGTPIQSLHSCANYPRRVGGLTGIGLAWEITAAWIALEIAVVTTGLQVGYLSLLLLEGLSIPPS